VEGRSHSQGNPPRGLAALAAVSFAAGALGWGVLAWQAPSPVRIGACIAFALVAVAAPPSLAALARRGVPVLAIRFVAVLHRLFVVPQLCLRIAGFHYAPGIQFGWPRPEHFASFVIDPELFWRMDPADEHVNAMGFPDDEVIAPKPPGVTRLLFLGNSCLAQGIPRLATARLQELVPARPFDDAVLAVPGYTTHQGLAAARRHGAELDPDLVVAYFGWDDHWLARGPIDAERVVGAGSNLRNALSRRLRIFQAADWLLAHAAASRVDDRSDVVPGRYRVPLADYAANLNAMVSLFAEAGVPVLLVTAPSSHEALGVPRYFVETQLVEDAATAVLVHRRYNETVRTVARGTGAALLDLERELAGRSDPEAFFTQDGIHFTARGSRHVANRIAKAAQAVLQAAGP